MDRVDFLPHSIAAHLTAQRGVSVLPLPIDLPPVPVALAWNTRFTTDRGHQWMRDVIRSIVVMPVGESAR